MAGQIFLLFLRILRMLAHKQKCEVWPHSDKTEGVSKGGSASLWHTAFGTKV